MTLGRSQLLLPNDRQWPEMLAQAAAAGVQHDVYHSAAYHCSPQLGRAGEPFLFTYTEGQQSFLWPYLLAPIELPGLGRTPYYDVTSVYGYAGPVASNDPDFIRRAWRELIEHWRAQHAVSAFTRFHPLLDNAAIGAYLQDVSIEPNQDLSRASGATISINLTLSSEQQVAQYRKILRHDIRHARKHGLATVRDEAWEYGADLVRLYNETLARRDWKNEYRIDEDWLHRFRETLGTHAHLFVTRCDGAVAAILLAMEYGPYLHAHLTASNEEFARLSPLKLLLDDVRSWGTERGLQSFHIGGGLGGRQDSLFEFKRRFSPIVHDFRIGCWILKGVEYAELQEAQYRYLLEQGLEPPEPGFFPSYRFHPGPTVAHSELTGVGIAQIDSALKP